MLEIFSINKIYGFYSIVSLFTMAAVALIAWLISIREKYIYLTDRILFWVFGAVLVGFAVFRPMGLARDDIAYIEILQALCPMGDCEAGSSINRDFIWYYTVKWMLSYCPVSLRLALLISGIGVLIKLLVIDILCRQRMLALSLFIPICYIQYDLTQLRAGVAIAWLMLGILCLCKSHWKTGALLLLSNFLVHFQAIFSPLLLTHRLLGLNRYTLPTGVVLFVLLVYLGFYPSPSAFGWFAGIQASIPVYNAMVNGTFSNVKAFPAGYLLIIFYGVALCYYAPKLRCKLNDIVSASLGLGVLLAWCFAAVPVMQTRLFEFYAVPIVLMAGNVGQSKVKVLLTVCVALILYLRLEFLNDWILG